MRKPDFISDILRVSNLVEGGLWRKSFECLRTAGLHVMLVYRFGRWIRKRSLWVRFFLDPIYFVLNTAIKVIWGVEIPRDANIGPACYIGHFGGIIISPKAKIGASCSISHGVTIGVSGIGKKKRGSNNW